MEKIKITIYTLSIDDNGIIDVYRYTDKKELLNDINMFIKKGVSIQITSYKKEVTI